MEYARCLREGVINREIYQDLRFSLGQRRNALTQRPPFDLSLDLANMISRVPIFAALDRQAIAAIAKRLRAHVAMPGETLVAKGEPADAMYFIAAGSVTVALQGKPIKLKDGDFFGEMGLLNAAPRNAEVVSDDYSHLLVLYKKDFHQLLRDQPQVRAEIEAVADRRAFEGAE
jgi:CPA1 family monovalent cation:H+ antiporter